MRTATGNDVTVDPSEPLADDVIRGIEHLHSETDIADAVDGVIVDVSLDRWPPPRVRTPLSLHAKQLGLHRAETLGMSAFTEEQHD